MDTSRLMYPKPKKREKPKKKTYFNSTIPLPKKTIKTAGRPLRNAKLKPFKVKKVLLKKIRKETEDLAKLVAKTRDRWHCKHCGKFVQGSSAHGSHIIPVSKGNALRFNPKNIFCMCYHCHMNWWHKSPTESGEWFATNYPELKLYLDARKNVRVKFTYDDYQRMIIALKAELKELEKENST